MKKSVLIKQQKERQRMIKEVNQVVTNAVKNFDFLTTLLVEGDPEATYYKIKDFREAVEKMIEEIKEENKKGVAK
jgi:ribosomal protein L17